MNAVPRHNKHRKQNGCHGNVQREISKNKKTKKKELKHAHNMVDSDAAAGNRKDDDCR